MITSRWEGGIQGRGGTWEVCFIVKPIFYQLWHANFAKIGRTVLLFCRVTDVETKLVLGIDLEENIALGMDR